MSKYTIKITENEARILHSLTTDTILAHVLQDRVIRALINITNRLDKQTDWDTSTPIQLTKKTNVDW